MPESPFNGPPSSANDNYSPEDEAAYTRFKDNMRKEMEESQTISGFEQAFTNALTEFKSYLDTPGATRGRATKIFNDVLSLWSAYKQAYTSSLTSFFDTPWLEQKETEFETLRTRIRNLPIG